MTAKRTVENRRVTELHYNSRQQSAEMSPVRSAAAAQSSWPVYQLGQHCNDVNMHLGADDATIAAAAAAAADDALTQSSPS